MEDESEINMQAGIKIPLLLFYYFLDFIQERMGVKEHQYKGKNRIEPLSNWAYLNLEDLYREIYCNTTYKCHICLSSVYLSHCVQKAYSRMY